MREIDKLLTPDEVAGILSVSRRTAYTIMHQMPHLERPFRVSESRLRAWLAEKTVAPAMEIKDKMKARQRAMKAPLLGADYRIPRRRT